MGERRLRHEEIREDVRAERARELLLGDLLDALLRMLFCRVVHEHVQPAELPHGALHHVPAERLVPHVAREEKAAPFVAGHHLSGLAGILVLVQVDDRDVRTFLRVHDGYGAADPAVPSRDDHDLVLELAGPALRGLLGARAGLHRPLEPWPPTLGLAGPERLLGRCLLRHRGLLSGARHPIVKSAWTRARYSAASAVPAPAPINTSLG